MKLKTIILALAVSSASVFSQGLVNFQNNGFVKISLDSTVNGGSVVQMGTTANAYSFYIAYGSSSGNLTFDTHDNVVYNSTSATGSLAGVQNYALPSAPGGTPVYVEVFGYSTSAGSYQNALNTPGAFAGHSAIVQITPSTSPTPGATIFGTTGGLIGSFSLQATPTPEPSTIALGALGGLSLLFVRRRK